jgi:hypothetical protein
MVERLYREGSHFITILDPKVLEEAEKWRHLTFLERKDKFVVLLRSYKSRVDKMMRGTSLEDYVLNVGKMIKDSKSNRVNNDLRQTDLEAGRKRPDRPIKKGSMYHVFCDDFGS